MHDIKYIQKEVVFLQQLIERLMHQEQVPGIELDIALKKTQEIYEQLLRLSIAKTSYSIEKKIVEEEVVFETVKPPAFINNGVEKEQKQMDSQVVAPKEVTQPEVGEQQQTIELDTPNITHFAEPEEIPDNAKLKIPEQHSAKQDASQKKQTILAEKIKTPKNQINETLSKQKPTADVSTRFQFSPLQSITSGIGLNDRFLYIKELFQGNADLYHQTIEQLDQARSLENALTMIDRNFKWDKENDTVKKFLDLVDRRHKLSGID